MSIDFGISIYTKTRAQVEHRNSGDLHWVTVGAGDLTIFCESADDAEVLCTALKRIFEKPDPVEEVTQ